MAVDIADLPGGSQKFASAAAAAYDPVMRAHASWFAALLLGGAVAQAQPSPPGTSEHREGDYGGVTPGQGSGAGEPDHPKRKRPPAKDELTWIGFHARDGGGGELFFQAPAQFAVVQWVDHGQVVIVLEGLHRTVKNSRRPLDTRYFDTPVARVVARPVGAGGKGATAHKSGIEVRVAFKRAKDAHEGTLRTATEADQMFYAYLDFGGGGGTVDVKPSDDGDGPDNVPPGGG